MIPAPFAKREKAPPLTRNELGRYIIADLIDDLQNAEAHMRVLRKQAESALAALNTAQKEKP